MIAGESPVFFDVFVKRASRWDVFSFAISRICSFLDLDDCGVYPVRDVPRLCFDLRPPLGGEHGRQPCRHGLVHVWRAKGAQCLDDERGVVRQVLYHPVGRVHEPYLAGTISVCLVRAIREVAPIGRNLRRKSEKVQGGVAGGADRPAVLPGEGVCDRVWRGFFAFAEKLVDFWLLIHASYDRAKETFVNKPHDNAVCGVVRGDVGKVQHDEQRPVARLCDTFP